MPSPLCPGNETGNFMQVFTQPWPKSKLLPVDTWNALHMEQGCPTHLASREGKINQTNQVKNCLLKAPVLTAGSDQSLPVVLSLEKLGIFYPFRISGAKKGLISIFQSYEEREVSEKGIQGSEREVLGCTSGIKPVKSGRIHENHVFGMELGIKLGKKNRRQKGKKR